MEIPSTTNLIPMFVESPNRGERAFDIYARLLRDRIVFLGTPVDDQVANALIAQMLFLEREDRDADIRLYINSPGGVVNSGLAIYDTMEMIKPDVATFCMGMGAGMAAVLLAAGAKGKRFAMSNARVTFGQGSVGFREGIPDVETAVKEARSVFSEVVKILAAHTGQSADRIERDIDAGDLSLSADDAKTYGIVDEILVPEEGSSAGRAKDDDSD
jgi:ATP-dependent Clp protease, protease subunit